MKVWISMKKNNAASPFDVAPFALPNTPVEEAWFELARDVTHVEVLFAGAAPTDARLEYLRKLWPEKRTEGDLDLCRPGPFGWLGTDDWFNSKWTPGAAEVKRIGPRTLRLSFQSLGQEMPDFAQKDPQYAQVCFRRTLAVRVAAPGAAVKAVRVFTPSPATKTTLRVELDAGRRTPSRQWEISGYNALIRRVQGIEGVKVRGCVVTADKGKRRVFRVLIDHMAPAWRYSHDEGLVTFSRGADAFTISLASLAAQGPIWFEDHGIYIACDDDATSFEDYRHQNAGRRTVAQQVSARPEQSLHGAMNGQPRPHPMPYCIGCTHARQKFWIEPNGDVATVPWCVQKVAGKDTPRYRNAGAGRWLFGLERWAPQSLYHDPWPVLANNVHVRHGELRVEQKAFAVPLERSILQGETAPDDTIVALVRFRFKNTGSAESTAELPIEYSDNAARTINRRSEMTRTTRSQTDELVPLCSREKLTFQDGLIVGSFQGQEVVRAAIHTDCTPEPTATGLRLTKPLAPGQTWEVVLAIPGVAVDSGPELHALRGLDFERCYPELQQHWRAEAAKSASLHTGVPELDGLYAGHLPIVRMTDLGMPDGSGLVNTSVGTMTYGNFTNESVMILQELDLRGRVEDVRRRLGVWVRYQGTAGLKGNFSDHDGVLFGAGGLEQGHSYNQHHGWALWYLARHYLNTGDREWFAGVAPAVIKGAEWIIRQRKATRGRLSHSLGWERGFLPAGALEDVDDYFYWLSTNCLTWRGLDAAAEALGDFGDRAAKYFRRQADAFRRDLIRGFETSRRHSPLIRLRDGRWIPHYPSRLYCRGRDQGWIREVIEGSVYLLLSGLYEADSKQGQWILDDFLDTRYMNPPFGYVMVDEKAEWYDSGGMSFQPNLLEGLLPHLDRDEIEIYLWMFFNSWASCYRAEAGCMVEHPLPVLGFSNSAPFKTSDQANAVKHLALMFVYERGGLLHLGRAIPRAWLDGGRPIWARDMQTSFGKVSIEYRPSADASTIDAEIALDGRRRPQQLLVRFRHPRKAEIRRTTVNGRPHEAFDPVRGDVRLPTAGGTFRVQVEYGTPASQSASPPPG